MHETVTVLAPPADLVKLRAYVTEYLVHSGCSQMEIDDLLSDDSPAGLRAAGNWVFQCLTAEAELGAIRRLRARVGRWSWLAPMLFLVGTALYVISPLLPESLQVLLSLGISVAVLVGIIRLIGVR